ncbi:MAG: hypothetical protein HN704_18335 [Bacteroidetes bacterium]|jgi:hypothetical protein|nr:hypothetical protein [Bacteroidota bacterium]MBT7493562.1 hypothetical protein [Bacteroidota bacterium]
MIFDTKINAIAAKKELARLIELNVEVEIKKVVQTRTKKQNRALHLFFSLAAKDLNELGITCVLPLLGGIETRWTKTLFKENTWKPMQIRMFGTESTTKLKRNQIDQVFEAINMFLGERGIVLNFPCEFDYYLNNYETNN